MLSQLNPSSEFSFMYNDTGLRLKSDGTSLVKISGSEIMFGETLTSVPLNNIDEIILIDKDKNFQKCYIVFVRLNSHEVGIYLRFYDDSLSMQENILSDWYVCEFA